MNADGRGLELVGRGSILNFEFAAVVFTTDEHRYKRMEEDDFMNRFLAGLSCPSCLIRVHPWQKRPRGRRAKARFVVLWRR
jgi:hypothetical protein